MIYTDAPGICGPAWPGMVSALLGWIKGRKEIMMEEKIKALALNEFGTLEGVTISYYVDMETRRVHYCFTRK